MQYKTFRYFHNLNKKDVSTAFYKAAETEEKQTELYDSLVNEGRKIEDCGRKIMTVQCNHCETNHFKSFSRCKSKFCFLCNKVKSAMWTARLLQFIRDEWFVTGNYIVFLNLTIKDTDLLRDGLHQLDKGWSYMTGSNSKYGRLFHSYFVGGFKAIEVKTGANSGKWHPHIHAICLKEKNSHDMTFLRSAWPASVAKAGGYSSNLEIMPFKPFWQSQYANREEYELSLVKSIKEVCKYITKFNWSDEAPERVKEMYSALYGKRQYSTWGLMYAVKEMVDHDLATKSDEECKDFVCQVCGCTKGHPNTLFKEVWDSTSEPIIKDYKTSRPETLSSEEQIAKIKLINKGLSATQREKSKQYVQMQESFKFMLSHNDK